MYCFYFSTLYFLVRSNLFYGSFTHSKVNNLFYWPFPRERTFLVMYLYSRCIHSEQWSRGWKLERCVTGVHPWETSTGWTSEIFAFYDDYVWRKNTNIFAFLKILIPSSCIIPHIVRKALVYARVCHKPSMCVRFHSYLLRRESRTNSHIHSNG